MRVGERKCILKRTGYECENVSLFSSDREREREIENLKMCVYEREKDGQTDGVGVYVSVRECV